MIINDAKQFVFVHIPKCAGSTVRYNLTPFDDAKGAFNRVMQHPAYGKLDYTHMPLPLLRDAFAGEYEKVSSYRSFALFRDPYDRFCSSLSQRIRMYEGGNFHDLTRDELAERIDRVISYIRDHPDSLDPEYIHFRHQADFVRIDGRRVVRNIFPVPAIGALFSELELIFDRPMSAEVAQNRSLELRVKLSKAGISRSAMFLQKRLPLPVYVGVRKMARKILFTQRRHAEQSLFDTPHVRAFIKEHYAEDIAIFRNLCARFGIVPDS